MNKSSITSLFIYAVTLTASWAAPTGTLRIDLEQALPSANNVRANVVVDLRCENGQFRDFGFAYCPALPAAEHGVRVEQVEWKTNSLRLVLEIGFLHELPRKLGGTGRYTVSLESHGSAWRGSYDGQVKGLSDKESTALWRELGNRDNPRWESRLQDGTVRSLTHVATDTLPILARANWVTGPQPRWPSTAPVLKPVADLASAGDWDCRYAQRRAQLGIDALAVHDDAATLVAARVVRRFLLSGLGETGASNGQPEFATALPVIKKFVDAYRQTHDVNLAEGTGLETSAPNSVAVTEDRRMGQFTMLHGDFVTTFSTGGVVPARRGHFTLSGLCRDWVCESPGGYNVVHVHPAQVTRMPAVFPKETGHVMQARFTRDGSGSVGMIGHGFVDPNGQPVESIGFPYAPKSWRTMGVDYSGASGAQAVLVFVEGHAGLGDRRQAWEADIGDVTADRVTIDGPSFTVKPPGTKATMRGTVVYPVTAQIDYLPPGNGRGGRIRLWRHQPEKVSDIDLEASLERKIEAIRLSFARQTEEKPDTDLTLALDLELDDQTPSKAAAAQLERQHLNYYAKMYKHTTSTSMGSPNRGPQARESWVIVLTIQDGPAPAIQALPFEDPALLKVGNQIVEHQEYLIEFRRTP